MTNTLLTKNWWKYLAIILLLYTIIAGFLMDVPSLPILNETIRNLHFHVPMWFGMILILLMSLSYSIAYLRTFNRTYDIIATAATDVGLWFGCFGMVTGMLWAQYTWGEWWSSDPKQNASAIALLIYFAYFILRGSIEDMDKRAKVSAVYNIIAFFSFIVLIWIIPRLTDSLHPGNGGNDGFSTIDMNNQLRKVFYPAILGWTLLGIWMVSLKVKLAVLEDKWLSQ